MRIDRKQQQLRALLPELLLLLLWCPDFFLLGIEGINS